MLIFLCEYIGKYFHRRRGTYIYYSRDSVISNEKDAANPASATGSSSSDAAASSRHRRPDGRLPGTKQRCRQRISVFTAWYMVLHDFYYFAGEKEDISKYNKIG